MDRGVVWAMHTFEDFHITQTVHTHAVYSLAITILCTDLFVYVATMLCVNYMSTKSSVVHHVQKRIM